MQTNAEESKKTTKADFDAISLDRFTFCSFEYGLFLYEGCVCVNFLVASID